MGLFKKSPAEKKLKELTGGFALNINFQNRLKEKGLSIPDGINIQKQLKNELKQGKISEESLEIRLNYLINEKAKTKNNTYINNDVGEKLDKVIGVNKLTFSFKQTLRRNGLTEDDGVVIRNRMLERLRDGHLTLDNFDSRLNQFIEIQQKRKPGYSKNKNLTNKPIKRDVEEKLDKVIGINKLTFSFKETLRRNGLTEDDGVVIRNRMLERLRDGHLTLDNFDSRLNQFIEIQQKRKPGYSKNKSSTIEVRKDKISNIKVPRDKNIIAKRKAIYLLNNKDNLQKCPKCNSDIYKFHKYCYNCGESINGVIMTTSEDIEKDIEEGKHLLENLPKYENNFNISSKIPSTSENKDAIEVNTKNKFEKEELTNLEELYNKKMESEYSTEFKFAYVLYLDKLSKNPSRTFGNDFEFYNTSVSSLKKQAKKDNYIGKGNPLLNAKSWKVADLKEILRDNNLKVSGRKDELIQRLGENLPEDKLKKLFPGNSVSVSPEGLEFIEKNRFVLIFDKKINLKYKISPDKFNDLFEDNPKYKDSQGDKIVYEIILEFYDNLEDNYIYKKEWSKYAFSLRGKLKVYKNLKDDLSLLDTYFKIYLYKINNYGYDNLPSPQTARLDSTDDIDELIKLLNTLNLDIDTLKDKFYSAYNTIKLPKLVISEEDSLVYLLKIFNGENIRDIEREINNTYA